MARTVLMVAFHFPPYRGGSGVHRTLKFSKYLPEFNWCPLVVSAHPRAYPQIGDEQLKEIPSEVRVFRTFALNAAKHLAVRGHYPRILALPDPWVSWSLGAIFRCLLLIRRYQPRVLWSTYPIATAHLIGLIVNRITGIPWVADFRDSMTDDGYPKTPSLRKAYQWIEKKAIEHASKLVFTTELTKEMYVKRYPQWPICEKSVVISNGYDENDFKELPRSSSGTNIRTAGRICMLHTGLIYPEDRNPLPFFNALSKLKRDKRICLETLKVELRGSGTEKEYQEYINKKCIADLVTLLPGLPYQESLRESGDADVLLLFQGSTCNHQIPAKAYEYLRLGKPILALTDCEGETAKLLKQCGGVTFIDMENEGQLLYEIPLFLEQVQRRRHPVPNQTIVRQFSRKSQAQFLKEIFECL